MTEVELGSGTGPLPSRFTTCFSLFFWRLHSTHTRLRFRDNQGQDWFYLTIRENLDEDHDFRWDSFAIMQLF